MSQDELMAWYGADTLASTQFFGTELAQARDQEKLRLATDKGPSESPQAKAGEEATGHFRTTVGRVVLRASQQRTSTSSSR